MMSHEVSPVRRFVHARLKPYAFKQTGNVWIKQSDTMAYVFYIQTKYEKYTFNVGVIDHEVNVLCWGIEDIRTKGVPACPINERVHRLNSEYDKWYDIAQFLADEQFLGDQIKQALQFFEKIQSRADMIEWLESSNFTKDYWLALISVGILQELEGRHDDAKQTFEKFAKRFSGPSWQERLQEVLDRLSARKAP